MKFDIAYVLCGAAVIFGLYWDVIAWPRQGRRPSTYLISTDGDTDRTPTIPGEKVVAEAETAEFVHLIAQEEVPAAQPPVMTDTGGTEAVRAEGEALARELPDLWHTADGKGAERDWL